VQSRGPWHKPYCRGVAGGQTPGRNGGVRESLRPPERSEELQEAIETVEAIIEGAEQLVSHLGIFTRAPARLDPAQHQQLAQVVHLHRAQRQRTRPPRHGAMGSRQHNHR